MVASALGCRAAAGMRKRVACAPTRELHAVHRLVGRAQHLFGAALLVRGDGDHAHARAAVVERCAGQVEPPLRGLRDALAERILSGLRRFARVIAQADHHKLVPAQARNQVLGSHHATHALCYGYKELVAHLVAVGVVDSLEVVQVQERDLHIHLAAPGPAPASGPGPA